MSKHIVVTGGAGFIGSQMCEQLVHEGHTLYCIDNLSLGSKANLSALLDHPRFTLYEKDLLDTSFLGSFFSERPYDVVMHLAANSDIQAGSRDCDVDYHHTFLTTYSLIKTTRHLPPMDWIFASSSAIYGHNPHLLSESTGPLEPVSYYGAAKLASEAFLTAFQTQTQSKIWVIRFPNVVGGRLTHGVIYDFIKKLKRDPSRLEILGDGNQTKPYVYVQDVIDGILFAWKNSSDPINTFNIGVESMTSVTDIAKMVIEEMRLSHVDLHYTGGKVGWVGDVETFQYDLTKIHQLGWSASYCSNDAVRLSIQKELRSA